MGKRVFERNSDHKIPRPWAGDCLRIAAIIPARMASSRFPGKALAPIHGLPMIEHVRRRVLRCQGFCDVVVATCDEAIAQTVRRAGGRVVMTSSRHPGGADRAAEAIEALDCTHVVIVQGDEPLVLPADLSRLAEAMRGLPEVGAWNAVAPLAREADWADRSIVKCVCSQSGKILFCVRDGACLAGSGERPAFVRQVLGLLAFERGVLARFAMADRTPYEVAASIDQSRLLETDVAIAAVELAAAYPGVNLPKDLKDVERTLNEDPQQRAMLEAILAGEVVAGTLPARQV